VPGRRAGAAGARVHAGVEGRRALQVAVVRAGYSRSGSIV
jgi:hypothetical protein